MPIVKGKKFSGDPLVTALIAAHDEELHLADCIESLLSQSYKNLNIIIVENASKDRTFEIAKEYEKKYKNISAFKIPPQKGPGNGWNLGVKKAKGPIVVICGADLIYGKDYIKKGLEALSTGESIGVIQKEETCKNIKNLWARAFFKKRSCVQSNGLSKVFTIIWKDYVKKRPFNSALGYADDQTINITEGTEFQAVDLEIFQTNPASFRDTWDHSLWVGQSIANPIRTILTLPVFPLYAIYKTLMHLKVDFYLQFIWFLPIYYSIRYFAYFIEALKRIK